MKKGLAIYVTHGEMLTLTITSKLFSSLKPEWQVLATLKNDEYTVSKATGIDLPKKPLNFDEFIAFINQIKTHSDVDLNEIKVCCDANLGTSMGHFVTQTLNNLLTQIKPQTAALFTSTPECIPHAQQYLDGVPLDNSIQLPVEVTNGFVVDRTDLSYRIRNDQPLPTLKKNVVNASTVINSNDLENLTEAGTSHKVTTASFVTRYLCWFKKPKVTPSNDENTDENAQKPAQNNPKLK